MADETSPSSAARLIGRYEVIREIGRGAMGRVFLARDPAIDRQVALKTVSILEGFPEAERREARERFIREARAAGALLHPNIITIFDVGEHEGMPFIAMEYVEGDTLDKYCRPPHLLDPGQAVALVAQAARALHHAHLRQIVHRDVKPANLMLTPDGKVKVTDFGLAKSAAAGLTQEGTVLGTPYYMSPEQVAGQELDGRSDLFSLAVVLYELVAGRRPFEGSEVSNILYRIVHEDPQPPGDGARPLPEALVETLLRALAKNRQERFPTGERLARALEDALHGERPSAGGSVSRRPSDATAVLPRARRPAASESGPGAGRALSPPTPGRWVAAALTGALLGFFPSLVNRSGGPVGPEPGPPRVSAVPVDVPQNARLRLDGVPLAGHNLPAAALQEGSHRLEVETPCERAETILSPGEQLPALQLQPRRVRLPLASRPPGAAVWLDGAPAGLTTPAVLELPLCVTHEIELREEGHEPVRLRLEAGQDWQALTAAPLALSKTPEGRVFVPVAPYAVTVLHKGRPVGRAGQLLTLPQGPALLVLRNEDLFLERPVDVLVRGGQTTTLPIEFPAPGNLSVQAHPSNCEVSLNARSLGAPPILNLPVAAGTHEVRCRLLTTGEEKIQKIQISSGRNATCQFKF